MNLCINLNSILLFALNTGAVMKATLLMTLVALFCGVVILLVFRAFAVKVDETEAMLGALLPGANCGGCGYSGCPGYAAALASGKETDCSKCTVGGQEVAAELAEALGKKVGNYVPVVAQISCQGSCLHQRNRYQYTGVDSCASATTLYSGSASCVYGCLGLGDCKVACEYGAIQIIDNICVIEPERCVACGACERACPKHLIHMRPRIEDLYQVRCRSHEKGPKAKEACSSACIGCTLCVKKCPYEAITMDNNVAVIDQTKCHHCNVCYTVCPTKAITKGLISPTTVESLENAEKKAKAQTIYSA